MLFKRARMTVPHTTMLTMEFLTQRLHHCISSKIYLGLRWIFLFGHLFLWCLRGKPWLHGSYVRFEEIQSPVSQCHGTFQNRFLSTVVCRSFARGSGVTKPNLCRIVTASWLFLYLCRLNFTHTVYCDRSTVMQVRPEIANRRRNPKRALQSSQNDSKVSFFC